jgi:hypothetical protein
LQYIDVDLSLNTGTAFMLTIKDATTIALLIATGGLASTQAPDIIWLLLAITLTSLALAIWYATRIYYHPFDPDLTWLSVAVGDGMYDISLGAFLWVITGSFFLGCLPLGWHLLWGLPMIIGQIVKNSHDVDDAARIRRALRGKG